LKTAKKIMAIILLLAMLFAIGACEKDDGDSSDQQVSQSSTLELPDGSKIRVETVRGSVGDYTIGYNPENFSCSAVMDTDTFTYTKWSGERNVYYSIFVSDMEKDYLADGLVYQNSDRYEECYSSSTYVGEYEAIEVWCVREIGAPDYDMHFFIIESSDGCYVIETQIHSDMYGEFYIEIKSLIDTVSINNPAAETEDNCPEPISMVGKWERTHTLVEGYEEESAPETCIITIKGDSEENLTITYADKEFPDSNYKNKPMNIDSRELYYDCGNDCWVADVDYVGRFDTTFALTLTEDDMLILQNYFLIDGAPAVSYEFFERVE